jgi:signal transduction histidine kinase
LTHGYEQALGGLARRLIRVHAQADLVRVTDEFLAETLRPQKHAVVLAERGEVISFGNVPPESMPALSTAAVTLPPRTLAAPSTTSVPELEVDPLPAAFARAGVVLAAPLQVDSVTTGAILLGRKHTERRYVEPDLALLADAAREVARTLERIRLVQTAATEADARRRAEELDRLKSDFLSRVAHDLRSPLASILWSTDNLLDGIAGTVSEHQSRYLQSVKVSAGHLNRLVSNLLDISRLEQSRARIDLGRVSLGDVLDQALPTLRPLAEQKGVTLKVDLRDPRPVQGNAEKLLEVVLNLVDNAIKFSPRDGTVEIRVERPPGGRAELSVRDQGPGLGGIDPQLLFQRFRQGAGSPHAPQQGFGLGLYIVKSYVKLMHGEVAARDRGGGGAVFTCTLPPADEAGGPRASDEAG